MALNSTMSGGSVAPNLIAVAEGLMSIGKVSKYLGISTRTLKNYERDGKIPSARRNPLNGHRI